MLVRFSSTATEPLLMFGDVARQLIKMMGATGAIPGGITAADLPAAIERLRQQLALQSAPAPPAASQPTPNDDDRQREPPPSLAARAVPLIDLLQRAQRGDATVMWEQA